MESLVSDIPVGDAKIFKKFLQCMAMQGLSLSTASSVNVQGAIPVYRW
jgi:hypothetical protein